MSNWKHFLEVCAGCSEHTVEPCLTDTPQQQTPMIMDNFESPSLCLGLHNPGALVFLNHVDPLVSVSNYYLAFPASVQQRKALKTQPHCAQLPNYAYHAYQKYTGIKPLS